MQDLGLRHRDVLRRANLPEDLLGREKASLTTEEYFRLWTAIKAEADDVELPLRFGEVLSAEAFDPPIFAALCSPNLNVALERIGTYKRLMCPMQLELKKTKRSTTMTLEYIQSETKPPPMLVAMELVFFVTLARLATRVRIQPLAIKTPCIVEPKGAYRRFFGVNIGRANCITISFKAEDAQRPFLTANEDMWNFFEPSLKKRLSEMDEESTSSDRVKAALLELLPSGTGAIGPVSNKLHVSTRTLQRRLREEGETFQTVLRQTREELARHYLLHSTMSGTEISFLLGFDDPNSFFRAFKGWTGKTPEQLRRSFTTA